MIRRVLLVLGFATLLAGAVIWIILKSESTTPGLARETSTTEPSSRLLSSRSAPQSADVHVTREPATQAQMDSARFSRYLPTERRLVENNYLNNETTQDILLSAQFDEFVRKMRDEMMANTDAKDVAELYIGLIQSDVADMQGLTMGQFACGAALCVGSINVDGDNSRWDQWMKKFDGNQNAPTYVFVDTPIDLGNGVTQHRIVFSTDPESNSVTGTL